GVEPVDHRARLRAGSAVRLLDGQLDRRLFFVAERKLLVDLPPYLAGRIVRYIEDVEILRARALLAATGDQNRKEQRPPVRSQRAHHSDTANLKRSSCSSRR